MNTQTTTLPNRAFGNIISAKMLLLAAAICALSLGSMRAQTLIWTGAADSNWNTTSQNWLNGSAASAYTPGAAVIFDDTSASGTIGITTAVSPASITVDISEQNLTFAPNSGGGIAGASPLIKKGTGSLIFSVENPSFTGTTTIHDGIVQIFIPTADYSTMKTGPVVFTGGTLTNNDTGSTNTKVLDQTITVPAGETGTIKTIKHYFRVTKVIGSGTLTMEAGNRLDFFTESFRDFEGELRVIGTGALRQIRPMNSTGGLSAFSGTAMLKTTLYLDNVFIEGHSGAGTSVSIGALRGTLNSRLQPRPADGTTTYTIGGKNIDTTFSGTLMDSTAARILAMTKEGAAVFTLDGVNAYTGATTVNAGALRLTGALAATPVTVNANGVFGGSGTAGGTVTFVAGAKALADVKLDGTFPGLEVKGAVTLGATLKVGPYSPDAVLVSGNYTVLHATGGINGTPTISWDAVGSNVTNATFTQTADTISVAITATPPTPPSITSSLAVTGTGTEPLTYTITAANKPVSFNATGLPDGFSIDTKTGVISGVLGFSTSVVTHNITLTATNLGGTDTKTLVLTVEVPHIEVPVITSPLAITGTVGHPFNYKIIGTDVPTIFTATPLPDALTLSSTGGLITGSLTATGTSFVNLTATNLVGTGTATLVIDAWEMPEVTSELTSRANINRPFSYTITTNGSPTDITVTGLPAGLTTSPMSAGQIVISGTPTAMGTANIVITASNPAGSDEKTLALTIGTLSPEFSSPAYVAARHGQAISYQIIADKSPTYYDAFPLPEGVSIDHATGLISGTPVSLGTYVVTIYAQNSEGDSTMQFKIVAYGPPPANVLLWTGSAATSGTGVWDKTELNWSKNGVPQAYADDEDLYFDDSSSTSRIILTGTSKPKSITFNVSARTLLLETSATAAFTGEGPLTVKGTGTVGFSGNTSIGSGWNGLHTFESGYFEFSRAGNTGPLVFFGGTAAYSNRNERGYITNFITVPAGQYGRLDLRYAFRVRTTLVGSGTLEIRNDNQSAQYQYNADQPFISKDYTGTLILSGSGLAELPTSNGYDFANNLKNVTLALEDATNMRPVTHSTGNNQFYIGALIGRSRSAVLRGGTNGPDSVPNCVYHIGGKNMDMVFAGSIGDWQEVVKDRNLKAALIKEGTGMLTLSGSHNYTWYTTVAAGALRFTKTARHLGTATITVTGSTGAAFGGAGLITPAVTFEDGAVLLVDANTATAELAGPSVTGRVTFAGSNLTIKPVVTGTGKLTNGVYTALFSDLPFEGAPALAWSYPEDPAIQAQFEYVNNNQIKVTITGGIIPKPVITSGNRADALMGQVFTYAVTALGDPVSPTILDATNLPAGLTFNSATGTITGTVATAGDYEINLSASNSSGTSTQTLTLRVYATPPPAPQIDSPLRFATIKSRSMIYQITASNFPTRFSATGLPHGVTVDANGRITGVPETVATYTVSITASNITGTDTKQLELIVSLPPPDMSTFRAEAEQFKPFSFQVEATNEPLGYSMDGFFEFTGTMRTNTEAVYTRGAVVSYLKIDPVTGVISGTCPNVEYSKTARLMISGTVFAYNNTGTGWSTIDIYVNPPAPVLQSGTTFSGVVGVPFTYQVPATNMYPAYKPAYGVTNIPKGLNVDPKTGIISGSPLIGGTFEVAFVASNITGAVARIVEFKINGASQLDTLAGAATEPGSADGSGSSAQFNAPAGGVADKNGNLYVVDTNNNSIRKVTPDGTVTTLVSTGLDQPESGVLDPTGTVLYVADAGSSSIKKIVLATGAVSTLAPAGTPALSAPRGLAIDGAGNLYVADTGNNLIRKIDSAGNTMTTIAGTGASGYARVAGSAATFDMPRGIAIDSAAKYLYVADTGNDIIRVITLATGDVDVLAGSAGSFGSTDGIGSAARFNTPEGLALDPSGILYVADTGNHTIRSIDTTTGTVITFAGNPNESGISDGSVAESTLENPQGLAISPTGEIYVLDTGNHTVRRLRVGPAIVKAPENQSVAHGSTATFTVVASGGPIPTYQWYKDDLIINGATESTLTLNNVQLSDVAIYRVVVTNPLGVRFASAALTVSNASPSNPTDVGAGGGGGSGGGGGGAPSAWYLAALALATVFYRFSRRRVRSVFLLCLLGSGLCVLSSDLAAQAVSKGTITGRVLNQATGQYLSNALVSVEGTGLEAITDSTGSYRIENVPVGAARVSASYAGLDNMTKNVTVGSATSATADFDMTAQVYVLEKFTVAGNREGSSRAVQEQRMSNTQKAIFAADSFGNIVDNNIGELMKNLPGITIDYDGTEDASTMRIRGMDPELASITLDGNEVASVGGDTESRAFNLKGAALQNIEKIELNAAPTADQPASTMGGQVNIVTKSALSRRGRQLRFAANMSINTAELNFDKTPGGGRTPDRKLNPGFNFSWSETFGKKQRFGFAFDVGYTRKYRYNNEYTLPNRYTYDSYTLAQNGNKVSKDTPGFVKSLQWRERGGSSEDRVASLSLDYQPWGPNHTFSLRSSYNDSHGLGMYDRSMRVTAGDQANGSSLTTIVSPLGVAVDMTNSVTANNTRTYSISGGGKHKFKHFDLDYNASYSRAEFNPKPEENYTISYGTRGLGMNIFNLAGNATGTIVQTSHDGSGVITPDDPRSYLNLANYNRLTLSQALDYGTDERLGGNFNITIPVSLRIPFTSHAIPIEIKTGARYGEQTRHTQRYWRSWKLTGSDTQPSFDSPAEPALRSYADPYFKNSWGFDVPIPTWVNPYSIMNYYNAHETAFYNQETHDDRGDVQTWEQMRREKDTKEATTGAYIQFTARLIPSLTMIAGLRYEVQKSTSVIPEFLGKRNASGVDRYSAGGDRDSNVQRFVVGTDPNTGAPIYEDNPYWIGLPKYAGKTAKEVLAIQTAELFNYRHNEITYPGEYFPNLQFKWTPIKNLQVRAARTTNIGRPSLSQLLAERTYNYRDRKVNTGNPDLQPSSSIKYDAAIEYYPGRDGVLTLSLFYQKAKDYIRETTRGFEVVDESSPKFTEADGVNVVLLEDIDSTLNEKSLGYWTEYNYDNVGKGSNQGFELSYNQKLDFIHSSLRNFQIYGAFSYADPKIEQSRHQMLYPSVVDANTMAAYNSSPMIWETVPMERIQKRTATLRLSYYGRRLSGSIAGFWVDSYAYRIDPAIIEITNQNAYLKFDLSVNYKINSKWVASFDWRNMTNVGDDRKIFDRTGGYFTSGMVINVSIRANF